MDKESRLGRRQFVAASALTLFAGCAGTGSNTTTSSSPKGDGSSSSQGGGGTSESKQKQKKASVKVGEVVEGDNLAMVVREVTETARLGEFQKAKSGNTYRVIRMAVKNTSGDYIDFNGFLQAQLKDDSNHVYDATVSSTDHPIQSGILAAGEVARGDIVFEVPKDASGLNLQFDFTTFDLFNFNRVTVALDEEAESIANLEQSLKVDVLSPGKTASQSDVSVVVHGVRTASELGSFAQAADGHEYIIPDIEITNNTNKELTVSTLLQMRVKTGTGLAYTANISGSSSLDQAYNEGSPIAAGESRRGELAYEVQTDAEPLYWVYDFLSINKPYKAFWKLR